MAKARAIVKRRKSVRNIKKITQTMQLVATARFQKCLQRALAGKPYVNKLTEMISVLAGMESVEHPLLTTSDMKKSILLVMTSNRGLCGSYNASVLRTALEHQRQLEAQGFSVQIEMVGKKGVNYLKFLGRPVSQAITDVEDKIAYTRVAEMAERYMDAYIGRQVGRVDVAYMRFLSVGSQKPLVTQLIPVEPPKADGHEKSPEKAKTRPDFEFSPPPAELLGRLIPETVKIRLYQCFNDAIVSEQVSRMVAMKAATDAAGDMIKSLTSEYNRARQSQITLELADIVGGAEAVKA
jgi:F-type H+-transporting ATPase subunit gamma